MNITVYLGANPGNRPEYARYAYELGQWIAAHGHSLVYGGSRTGLMGELADGALGQGGGSWGWNHGSSWKRNSSMKGSVS